jgi:threonine synthase
MRPLETPLIRLAGVSKKLGNNVYAKLESANPTGSHKDRESMAMIRDMLSKKAKEAVIASTGNAAISLSALAPCEGITVNVFTSNEISQERLNLISAFAPRLYIVKGDYDYAVHQSEIFAESMGIYDANPGHNSCKPLGDSKIGFELVRQLRNRTPDYVVVPTNNGTLLSGVWMGFKANGPRMIAAVSKKSELMGSIAGYHRFDGRRLARAISESAGEVVDVKDEDVAKAIVELRLDGVFCEPAAAASLAALKKLDVKDKAVVLLITGSAFKFLESYIGAMGFLRRRRKTNESGPFS